VRRRGRALRLGALAAALACNGEVRAQAPSPADSALEAPVRPPRLRSSADVTYPAGAAGDARVELTLTVGADGAVVAAEAAAGPEPFASAAVSAAQSWRFEPALRAGKPTAVQIRFEVLFTEPPAPANAPANRGEAPPDPAPPSGQARPIEVTVEGERPVNAPAQASMGRAEVRELPGAFGDPFRAIEAMPGVTPIASGLPFFYVRGAPPGNVGYFIDGVRVPYLFHIGAGPAVIHPALVERVDLYSAAYPARFGRYSGGIVAAETNQPRPELHGEYNVRLFDLGALAETGFADGRGTALAAFRYSYTAAAISLFVDEVQLDYRDYEARVSYDVTPDDRLTLFSFGSYDLLGERRNDELKVLYGSEFYRVDARYDHRLGRDSSVRTAVTFGWDQTRIPDQPRNARDTLLGARVEASHAASEGVTLRGGADVQLDAFQADDFPNSDPDDPNIRRFNELFPPREDVAVGGHADVVLRGEGVEVTPGLRVDLYRSGGETAVGVDPRIASRIRVGERVHVLHTFGIAHQPPSFLIPLPGLAIGELRGGLQRSIQASAGVELALPEETTASLTAFENVFLNMSDTLAALRPGEENVLADVRSQGSAHGLELYVRRKMTRKLGGFLSYTLSRSSRSLGRERFPSGFDRTHVGNAAIAYDLGRRWRAGTRFTLYTGVPKLPNTKGTIPPLREKHPEREPLFYRLDLRLEKRWVLGKAAWIAFVAEVMNVTLNTETLLGEEFGPVTIPSLGVEGGF
jgi:hypothetical protein